jgi:hypothetical protein
MACAIESISKLSGRTEVQETGEYLERIVEGDLGQGKDPCIEDQLLRSVSGRFSDLMREERNGNRKERWRHRGQRSASDVRSLAIESGYSLGRRSHVSLIAGRWSKSKSVRTAEFVMRDDSLLLWRQAGDEGQSLHSCARSISGATLRQRKRARSFESLARARFVRSASLTQGPAQSLARARRSRTRACRPFDVRRGRCLDVRHSEGVCKRGMILSPQKCGLFAVERCLHGRVVS